MGWMGDLETPEALLVETWGSTLWDVGDAGRLLIDDAGRILAANGSARQWLCLPEGALNDLRLAELADPSLLADLLAHSAQTPTLAEHHCYFTVGGERLAARAWFCWAADRGVGLLVFQGLPRSQNHESHLTAVGRLAAGVAHDFNNSLTSIIGFGQLIEEDETLSQDVRDAAAIISDQGRRSARLTRQLLDFSCHSMLQIVRLNLTEFLADAARIIRSNIDECIVLEVEAEPADCPVDVDPEQLNCILLNVCRNARDAMPDGGTLRLSLRRVEGAAPLPLPSDFEKSPKAWAVMDVGDTGTGIPSDVLPHIFEPFYTTKARGQGSGLGLSQAYGLVRQHGGLIGVDSTIGQGTTLTICLPIAAAQSAGETAIDSLVVGDLSLSDTVNSRSGETSGPTGCRILE